jgi:hypothetical protein
MKKLLVFALLALAAWFYGHEPQASWRGMPAAQEPLQTSTDLPRPFHHGELTITPLAGYSIKAVVLSRQRYRYDALAELAPLDLALGWGPMSMAAVINELSISQSGRWYEYSWSGEEPLPPGEIALHSANTHCLPASPAIRRQLLAVKRHDVVTLDGYLVEVTGPGAGNPWRSSLSRTDTRGGACEILWVTAVRRAPLKATRWRDRFGWDCKTSSAGNGMERWGQFSAPNRGGFPGSSLDSLSAAQPTLRGVRCRQCVLTATWLRAAGRR